MKISMTENYQFIVEQDDGSKNTFARQKRPIQVIVSSFLLMCWYIWVYHINQGSKIRVVYRILEKKWPKMIKISRKKNPESDHIRIFYGPLLNSIWNIQSSLIFFPMNYFNTIWQVDIRRGDLLLSTNIACILKICLNCCFSFSNLWKKFYRLENKIHHTSINITLVNYNNIHKIYGQGNLLDAYSHVEEQSKK